MPEPADPEPIDPTTIEPASREWFDEPDPTGRTSTGEVGLRFSCTQCGDCCSGSPGYVGFTAAEARAIAEKIGVSVETFMTEYTRDTAQGRSIKDLRLAGAKGYDCVFLDRETAPGKARCSVYEVRPMQCRTWPFWGSNLVSRDEWNESGKNCPGLNTGPLHSTEHVRLTRDRVEI